MTAPAKRRTQDAPPAPPAAGWLTLIATLGVIALAGVRIVTTFLPDAYMAGDPRADTLPAIGFGPAGAAVIDWLCVVALALAVIDARLRRAAGGRTRCVMLALWLIGAVFAVCAGGRDFESMRIGGHWLGALALGIAATHVAQVESIRRFMIAACLGLLIPLAAQGLFQVTISHAETVANYKKDPEAVLRTQGIVPGSTNQRKFEERLYQVEATGQFGFSNIYGSMTMALSLLGAGVAAGMLFGGRRGATMWLAIAVTALGVVALGLSFSKGATLACGATVAATAVTWLIARRLRWGAAWWRTAAYGAVALGLAAVLARGAIGEPDTAAGERSLMFRYQYLQAASRMIAEHPVIGVGPGLFKARYLTTKNPLSPEDVADPHSIFASYLATLGIGGAAWCVLLLTLLWHAGRAAALHCDTQRAAKTPLHQVGDRPGEGGDSSTKARRASDSLNTHDAPPFGPLGVTPARLAIAIAVVVFATEYAAQYAPATGFVGLVIGAGAGFVMLLGTRVILTGFDRKDNDDNDDRDDRDGATGTTPAEKAIGVAMWCVAGAVAVGMFPLIGVWVVGTGGFIAVTVALAAALRDDRVAAWASLGLFAAAVGLMLHSQIEMTLVQPTSAPLALAMLGLAAAWRARTADKPTTDGGDDRNSDDRDARADDDKPSPLPMIITACVAAVVVVALGVTHLRPVLAHESLVATAAADLKRGNLDGAIGDLSRAALGDAGSLPPDDSLARDAARYMYERGRFDDAMKLLDDARAFGNRPAQMYAAQARLAEAYYRTTRDPKALARALDAAIAGLPYAPYDMDMTQNAADLAWAAGRRDDARRYYTRLLELSDQAYLDPEKPLRDDALAAVKQRLATLDAAPSTPTPAPAPATVPTPSAPPARPN